jgi:hypothetical protein
MQASSWPPTSSSCRRSRSDCSSSSLPWRTTVDESCTWRSLRSHGGLDCTAATQRLLGARRAAIAAAERLRGTRHRLDRARVPPSHHRAQRRRAASSTHRVHHLLHAVTNAVGTGEGRADLASGHAVVGRRIVVTPHVGGAPPSLRSRGCLIAVGRRPAQDPLAVPPCSTSPPPRAFPSLLVHERLRCRGRCKRIARATPDLRG